MAVLSPMDAAALYDEVLALEDDFDAKLRELGPSASADIVALRDRAAHIRAQLEDYLDVQESIAAFAEANEHGATSWETFERSLDT